MTEFYEILDSSSCLGTFFEMPKAALDQTTVEVAEEQGAMQTFNSQLQITEPLDRQGVWWKIRRSAFLAEIGVSPEILFGATSSGSRVANASIPNDVRVYACIQSLFKWHSDFLRAVSA